VVIPGWIGDKHILWADVPRTKQSGKVICARSCYCLYSADILVICQLATEQQLPGLLVERSVAGDGQVFVVEILVMETLFGLVLLLVKSNVDELNCALKTY